MILNQSRKTMSNSRLINQSECCIHKVLNYFFICSGADEGKWNRTSILLLLDEYKKNLKNFNDPKMKLPFRFEHIAKGEMAGLLPNISSSSW
jgi:hypothetical protein